MQIRCCVIKFVLLTVSEVMTVLYAESLSDLSTQQHDTRTTWPVIWGWGVERRDLTSTATFNICDYTYNRVSELNSGANKVSQRFVWSNYTVFTRNWYFLYILVKRMRLGRVQEKFLLYSIYFTAQILPASVVTTNLQTKKIEYVNTLFSYIYVEN